MPIRAAVITDERTLIPNVIDAVQADASCTAFGYLGSRAARIALRAVCADVVLIDYDMPDALALCEELADDGCRAILINVPDDSEAAVDALGVGARGVVFVSEPISDIPRAMHIVQRGQVWSPRHVIVGLWMRFKAETAAASPSANEPEIIDRLSIREREVLRHAATGLANKEVATRLAISEATVKVHLTHIFQKLGLRSRGELAAAYFGHHPNVVRRIAN